MWRGSEARHHLRVPDYLVMAKPQRRGDTRMQVLAIRERIRELVTGPSSLTAILTSLNLSGCPNLTDHMVSSWLGQQLPALAAIHLSLCRDVTDQSLYRLSADLPTYLAPPPSTSTSAPTSPTQARRPWPG